MTAKTTAESSRNNYRLLICKKHKIKSDKKKIGNPEGFVCNVLGCFNEPTYIRYVLGDATMA